MYSFPQGHTWRIAKLATRLVNRHPIVGPEQLGSEPRYHRLTSGIIRIGDQFREIRERVERTVGYMQARRRGSNFLCDGSPELLLRKRIVVGQIVCLANSLVLSCRQQQAADPVLSLKQTQCM